MEFFLIFFYLGCCVVVAVAANTRGRNALGWFVLSLLISPLLAGLLVLAMKNQTAIVQQVMPNGTRYLVREKIRTRTPQQARERAYIFRAVILIFGALYILSYFVS